MIDEYIHVQTSRSAPEARIPVWDYTHREFRLGGAANVANNLKSMGGDEVDIHLAGLASIHDRRLIAKRGIDVTLCSGDQTMIKTRYVDSNEKILFRFDNHQKVHELDQLFLYSMLEHFSFDVYDAVVVSDYDKGTIDSRIMEVLQKMCISPTIVDSKRKDLRLFENSTVLKINESEYATQVSSDLYPYIERLFDYVVVTKGASGSELRQCEISKSGNKRYMIHSENFKTEKVQAKDVTGCGDTHTAALCFSLLKNNGDIRMAVRFANACATRVVQKFGTSVVNDIPPVV